MRVSQRVEIVKKEDLIREGEIKEMNRLLFLLILAMALTSCDKSVVFEKYVSIPEETWNADSLAEFNINVTDTTKAYNLYVNVRNTVYYPYQNIYFFIDVYSPSGATLRDTLECYLADEKGKWLGKGNGNLRDNRFGYRTGVKFSTAGNFRFDIQQAMRVQKLKGIANIGFRVEEAKKATSKVN